MKKTFVAIALASALAVTGFAGCAKKIQDTDQFLEVYCLSKGYGTSWLTEALETFSRQDWVKEKYPSFDYSPEIDDLDVTAHNKLSYGENANTADILFGVGIAGYGCEQRGQLLNITETVYKSEVPGEPGVTVEGKMFDWAENASRYPKESTDEANVYYAFPWSSGMNGIIYNATLLQKLGLEVPLTTNKLVEVCDVISNTNNADYDSGYAIMSNNNDGYWAPLFNIWWAQYDGMSKYTDFYYGISGEQQSPAIFASEGRLKSLEVLESLFRPNKEPGDFKYDEDKETYKYLYPFASEAATNYRLMTTVSDEDGNTYDVSAEVSVNDTPVTVTGNSFTVSEKGSYRVVYTAEGHENTMTVILKVVDRTAPVITIGERVTFVAAGEKYYLPEVSVHEEFDETAPECTVTVIAEDGTALKKEKDDIGEYVVPENDGTYTYNASAQDIAGNKRDESFTFEAVSVQEGEWNLLSSESVSLATRTYSEAYAQNYQWYESVLGEEGVISYDLVGGVDAEFPLDYFGVMPIVKDVARYKDAGWLVMRMYFDGDDGSVKNLWYGHSNIGRLSFPEIVYNEWNDYYLRITDEFVGSFKDFADGTNFSRIHGELEKNVKVYLDGIYVTSEGPQDATPIQESEVVFINNDLSGNHIYNLNSAIQSEFVSSEDMTPLGFDGEYDGNAIKFVASDYAHINAEYMIDPRIDATAYDAAVTAGYTHMYIWVCISADDGSNLLGGLFRPGTESWGIPTANTWIKVSVALTDDLKEKLFTEGGTQLFSTWADNQTGKQEIYVGNIGFEKQVSLADEGYVVRIDGAETLANIFNASADIQSEFVSSEDMAALGFAGEYDGNAIKFTATGAGYNNYGYTLVPAITAEEYDAAIEKNGYTHLYIWICLSADNGSSVWDGLFVPQGGMWAIPTYDLWTKLTIELTPELKEKLFENGGAPLLRIYTDDQSGRQELYVGNIGFEKQVSLADEGYVVRIDGAETLANISNTDGIPSEFVAATDMVELNFTGDYSGNAIKFTAGDGAHMNGGYKFVPAVTQAEYENAIVKNGYTHLYIWVCASADDGVALFDGLLGTGNNWGIPKADTWIKVSVPLSDDLKTRLFADGGTQLLRTWTDNVQAGKQEIYVGNIGFEKQAA